MVMVGIGRGQVCWADLEAPAVAGLLLEGVRKPRAAGKWTSARTRNSRLVLMRVNDRSWDTVGTVGMGIGRSNSICTAMQQPGPLRELSVTYPRAVEAGMAEHLRRLPGPADRLFD